MMRSILGAAALSVVMVLGACSPASNSSSSSSTETTDTSAAATTTDTSAAATTTEAPAATLVSLDIHDTDGTKLSGDPAKGAITFHQCMTCHSAAQGVNRVGPSLYGVVGRHSGIIPGFNYSDANKNSGITWTEQELFTYLENPQRTVPGTRMAFAGLRSAQQRADVIAFLKTNAQPH